MSSLRKRLVIAAGVCLISGLTSWAAQVYVTHSPGGDFISAIRSARDLISWRDPYGYTPDTHHIPYPLPASFVGILFSFLPVEVGASLFFGLSSAVLSYGLTSDHFRRLAIFAAFPFWFALIWAQWSPLIMAAAFFPVLSAVVLIKPHVALPVILTRLSWKGIFSCVIVLILSLIVYPRWPFVWLSQLREFQRFYPILTFPFGPLLLLSLLRWRDRDARLLLLAAVFPQRVFYDAFILWLIPKTRREIVPTVLFSWGAFIWRLFDSQASIPLLTCGFFFLPMLVVVLQRRRSVDIVEGERTPRLVQTK